jgi:hypothetical protein
LKIVTTPAARAISSPRCADIDRLLQLGHEHLGAADGIGGGVHVGREIAPRRRDRR